MPTVFFLARLRPGVEAATYEQWVRSFDYPTARSIPSIISYTTHRIAGPYRQAEVHYDYIEVVEVTNIDENGIGDLIADGQIIGLFRGNSECGPRALGHRSIICRPDLPNIRDRLNDLKNREWFRPFAPIILEPYANDILNQSALISPYMSMAGTIKEGWHDLLQGVCHVDGSTRPQILNPASEPFLYAIIQRVYDQIKIPAIIKI